MPTKFKTSILIFGIIVMCLLACLATFLVLAFSGVLMTEKIQVEITVQAATKVYDGTPLTAYEYKIEGDLAEGHKESVTFTDSLTDAGECESGANVRVLDEDGYDVTAQYAIKVNAGLLRVTRQNLSVAIGDTEVVYSGDRIIFDDYILRSGTLAKGHKIGAESAVGVIQPGVVESKYLTPAVYDAFGNDVTANYNIAFSQGTVQVSARPLIVRPKTLTKEYDGKALMAEGIEIVSGSLIAGHYIRATEFQTAGGDTAQLTEVGKLPVYVKSYSVYDAKGENVSEYYKVTNEIGDPGVLEVTPREITVVGKSKAWEYDGNWHAFTSVAGREDTELGAEMTIGLAEGHSVVVNYDGLRGSDGNYINRILGVGKIPCVINGDNVKILDESNADKSQNYHATYVNGTLTVTPKTVRITVKDYTVEYSEEAIPEETLKEQIVLFDPFVSSDFELVTSAKEYKNAGVYSLSAKPYVNENPETEEEIEAEEMRKELFKNYQVDVVPGTVTITKKTIDITVSSFSREYTGQEISDETILNNVSFRGNFDKDSFEIDKDVEKIIDAGQYRISVKFKEGSEPSDDFDSDNYTLSIIPGTLTVTPKKVGVMVMSHSVEYSGNKVPASELQKLIVCGEGFDASDFKITGDESGFINVGTYVLGAQIDANKTGASEKLKNYEPDVTPGTLTVTKKKVIVRINNAEKEYTPEENAYADTLQGMIKCDDTALAETAEKRNSMLRPVVDGEFGNAGSYVVSAELRDSVQESVTQNIELDVIVGTFTIRPKTVNVTMVSDQSSYTGDAIELDDIPVPTAEGLTGISIVSSNLVGAKNAGEYTYTAEMVVLTESGDVSPNYTLRAVAGVWTIIPAEVVIQDGTEISKVYDGKPVEINGAGLQLDFGSAGLSSDINQDNFTIISVEYEKTEASVTGGDIRILSARIRDNASGQECFNFLVTGTVSLTVTERKLQISIGSITVPQGTSTNAINNILSSGGGVSYFLMGLADGDFATVEFYAQTSNGVTGITVDTITIYNQNQEDVTSFYNIDAFDDVQGMVYFI